MKKSLVVVAVMFIAVSLFAMTQSGFLDGSLYVPAPFKLYFGTGASTDVPIWKIASNRISVGAAADSLAVNSVIVPQTITAQFVDGAAANATDRVFFIADTTYQVTGCTEIHSVAAGGASVIQVVKDTGTTAPGAGTDLLTNNTNGGFDLNATANTLQTGTLSVTASDLQLAAGDRLSVDYAQTIQSSAGVRVACTLKRI